MIDPEHLFSQLRSLAPPDTVWVIEATSMMDEFWAQLDAQEPGSVFLAAGGALGFGLPASVGIQLANPERQVVALIGDGSANYSITALWSAAHYGIKVIFVILKNESYGAVHRCATALQVGDVSGLDLPGIEFARLAQGYGMSGTSVTTVEDFSCVFRLALSGTTPTLIEAQITSSYK